MKGTISNRIRVCMSQYIYERPREHVFNYLIISDCPNLPTPSPHFFYFNIYTHSHVCAD